MSNPTTAPTINSVISNAYGNANVTFTSVTATPPITNYKYSLDGGNSNTWIPCSPAIPTATITSISFTIYGLSSGTTYRVSIKATNITDDGPPSNDVNVTTTSSTTGPFSTIGTNSIIGINNNIPNLSVNTNCLAFHAPMGVYFTNPNLYAPTSQYFNFDSNKGFTFNSGNTRLATIDTSGSLWCNGLNVVGAAGGAGNIICESNMIVLGKVSCPKLQISSNSSSSTIVSIRCINFLVGAGTSAIKTGNVVTYGVTYPDITKLFFDITPFLNSTQANDTFSATIVFVTTTSMTFNVQRTDDNSSWANDKLCVHIIITEIA